MKTRLRRSDAALLTVSHALVNEVEACALQYGNTWKRTKGFTCVKPALFGSIRSTHRKPAEPMGNAMELVFEEVRSDKDIQHLALMADEIWHEYWPDIIGIAQTDYMVEAFQSVEALTNDIRHHGYRYWILEDSEGNPKGFTGAVVEHKDAKALRDHTSHSTIVDERWPDRLFVSKIYLYAAERGRHYASRVIEFYEQLCINEGLSALYLTVNRANKLGIRAYAGRGFLNIEETDTDIGGGFVMTDYVMAKEIG